MSIIQFPRALLSRGWRVSATWGCLALIANSASATLIVTAPSINVPYSATAQSGSFEVYLKNTGSPGPQVGDTLIELQVAANSGLMFSLPVSSANAATVVHPYIFPGGAPTPKIADGGHDYEATDFAGSTLPTATDGLGLVLVNYTIAGGALGTIPISFVPYPQGHIGTGLFDSQNNQISTTLQGGVITIVTPVPEPAGMATWWVLCGGWWIVNRRRRGRSS